MRFRVAVPKIQRCRNADLEQPLPLTCLSAILRYFYGSSFVDGLPLLLLAVVVCIRRSSAAAAVVAVFAAAAATRQVVYSTSCCCTCHPARKVQGQ